MEPLFRTRVADEAIANQAEWEDSEAAPTHQRDQQRLVGGRVIR